ncbi:MAG: aspartate/glutamate racemase family protein [Candidatus Accumulibacter sp.]|jgi:aspartate/glutamate racemase|nr:aspartate/glutamate racemase family protein [Accumulibacter sp.]
MEYEERIAVLQTSFAKREDTVAYLEGRLPGVRVDFITDSSLLPEIRRAGKPTQPVIRRMTLYAMAAEAMGADLILNSCSTVGEVADVYAKVISIPVVKIDDAMAREAAGLGGRIALIATLPTTLGPSRRAIERYAQAAGRRIEFTECLDQLAWEALAAGDAKRHNEILIESIRRLDAGGYNAIVMAQVSMRALLPALEGTKTPILCSFYSGLDAVVEKVKEIHGQKAGPAGA